MGRSGQWGRIGPANTRGSSYTPPIESTISIFPPPPWPFHLWVPKEKRTPENSSSSPALARLPDVPSTSPSSPRQGDNSSRHGAVATTERRTVSAWMQICGRAGSLEMQTRAEEQRVLSVLLKYFCWGSLLFREIALPNNRRWDEGMCHVLQVASLDSYLVNIS